jgi:hypothetical protein
VVVAAMVGGLLHAGLRPYDLRRANEVEQLAPGPGLGFRGRGIVWSEGELGWSGDREPAELALEIRLRPRRVADFDGGVALGLFDDQPVAPLLLAQWKSGLYVRARVEPDPSPDAEARPDFDLGFRTKFRPGEARFLAVCSGPEGTEVFVDGVANAKSPLPIVPAEATLRGRLVLGNDDEVRRGWHGEILGLALYVRYLSGDDVRRHAAAVRSGGMRALEGEAGLVALYAFDASSAGRVDSLVAGAPLLRVPAIFRGLERHVLGLPRGGWKSLLSPRRDQLLNLAGFVPLGLVLTLVLRRRKALGPCAAWTRATLLGAGLSLAIEIVQIWLPTRVSSAPDLLLNSLGTALGAALPIVARRGRPC